MVFRGMVFRGMVFRGTVVRGTNIEPRNHRENAENASTTYENRGQSRKYCTSFETSSFL
jgi:hypothetical protein